MSTTEIENILEKADVKPTSNRILVLREIVRSTRPLSLMDLDSIIGTLDKSSIFRVLTLLLEHDVIHAIEDGRGIIRYEICLGHHHSENEEDENMHVHFFCEKCKQVFCFPAIQTPHVNIPDGFSVHSTNYMLKGICPACSGKK